MRKIMLCMLLLAIWGCSSRILKFEQYSVAMNLAVSPDSSLYIGKDDQFSGILWLQPILKAENIAVKSVKLIQNYGRFFLCAENFKNVWLIEPAKDGLSAKYKAVDVTPKDKNDVLTSIGFSRYGTEEVTYVKFRFNKNEVLIDKKGGIDEKSE